MKKPFNPSILANELQDTGFFRRPAAPEPKPVESGPTVESPPLGSDAWTPRRLDTKTPGLPDVQVPRPLDAMGSKPLDTHFDLTNKAASRQTLRLTEAEFRKLGMVQGRLSELLDVTKVDKNDIIRAAVHRVFEEFDQTGSESDLVKRLRKKYR